MGSYDSPVARKPQGRFLGIPYNWSRPSWHELWVGLWDPADRRIVPPKNFGWGYRINFAALVRRLTRR